MAKSGSKCFMSNSIEEDACKRNPVFTIVMDTVINKCNKHEINKYKTSNNIRTTVWQFGT